MSSNKGKNTTPQMTPKDPPPCCIKSVPLKISTPQEHPRDPIRSLGHDQVERPLYTMNGHGKEAYSTSLRKSVLGLPISSSSLPISTSSSQGLVLIIIIPLTTMNVRYPKKKCDSKGEPPYRTKDKHQIEKMPSEMDIYNLVQIWRKYIIPP